jgi:hypothetical protein
LLYSLIIVLMTLEVKKNLLVSLDKIVLIYNKKQAGI